MASAAGGSGCPLDPPPTYGCGVVSAGVRFLRRLSVVAPLATAAAGAVLLALYASWGDRELLLAGLVLVALAPMDAVLLRGLSGVVSGQVVGAVRAVVEELGPVAYSLQARLDITSVSAELPGGRLAVVVVESGRAYGALLEEYSVTGRRPSTPRPPALHALLGSLRDAVALSASTMKPSRLAGGCAASKAALKPGTTLEIPSPHRPEVLRVTVARGLAVAARCPARGRVEAARLAAAMIAGAAAGAS